MKTFKNAILVMGLFFITGNADAKFYFAEGEVFNCPYSYEEAKHVLLYPWAAGFGKIINGRLFSSPLEAVSLYSNCLRSTYVSSNKYDLDKPNREYYSDILDSSGEYHLNPYRRHLAKISGQSKGEVAKVLKGISSVRNFDVIVFGLDFLAKRGLEKEFEVFQSTTTQEQLNLGKKTLYQISPIQEGRNLITTLEQVLSEEKISIFEDFIATQKNIIAEFEKTYDGLKIGS